ncbi:MAG: cytochrome P450 [Anaerolineae bacterium]|jgi:cytochrome P450
MSQTTTKFAPGPQGLPLIGSIGTLRAKGPLDFWFDLWQEYGDVARAQMGPQLLMQFVRPEHVQHILVKNKDNYVKGPSHDSLRIPLGTGILTAEGDLWRRQRRLMSPTYTPRAVQRFADIMLDATDRMLARWREIPAGKPVAINLEMMRLAMSVISRSIFTVDIGQDFVEAGQALTQILDFASQRSVALLTLPLSVPTPGNQRLNRALATIDQFLYGIIADRRRKPPGDDLLSLLMEARDEETGEAMSEKQLRDEVLITFFAGHETTAQLLTWAWYLFSEHPVVEERFHTELEEKLGGRSPGVDDVEGLSYTRMVMDETLRLYSPVAIMARDAVADDTIDGYEVPAGTIITVGPYMTHRHPEFWERPVEFYPDHFAQDQVEARPRYAYYPFGAGPRVCLGKHFALLEGALVLAEVGQRYRPRLVPGQEIKPHWSGTLRPDGPVMMVLEDR